jgi:hypothetical protein
MADPLIRWTILIVIATLVLMGLATLIWLS